MTPYLAAHAKYHEDGPPFIKWTAAVDFHLQAGFLFNTPHAFLMARLVPTHAPDHAHPTLTRFPGGDVLHVWSAAGDPVHLLRLFYQLPPVKELTFQRRNARLHRIDRTHFQLRAMRHLFTPAPA